MISSIKKLILLIFLAFQSGLALNAQDWKLLKQDALNLIYEIPRSWFVGGVMNEKACHCAAGTLNSSIKDGINMVIFTSSQAHPNVVLQEQEVWGYHYKEKNVREILSTPYFTFEQTISTWQEDANLQVLRLYTMHENKPVLLYFWSEATVFEEKQNTIKRIVNSIRPNNIK